MNTSSLDLAGVYLHLGSAWTIKWHAILNSSIFFFPTLSLYHIVPACSCPSDCASRQSHSVTEYHVSDKYKPQKKLWDRISPQEKKRGKKRWSCKAEGLTLFLVTAHWITCRHASGALRDTEQSWPTRAKPQRLQAVLCVPVLVNCWTENISITVINSIIKGNSADSQALSGLGGVHSLSLSVGGYLQGGVCHQAALGGAALKPSDTLAAKKGSRGEV